MDGFRKPFEYNEEKRGILLLFIIMLLSVDMFLALSFIVQVHNILKDIPGLSVSFVALGMLFILFILFTVLNCYKLKKNMVLIAKVYLIVRAVFSTLSIIIIYLNNINNKSMIGNGVRQYHSFSEMTFTVLLAPLMYVILFSGIWYLYFTKSKRYKNLV